MTDNLFADLAAPFSPDVVSWRVGATTQDKSKGMALAYIDARDVMDRLDKVVGPANWQCEYPHANGKTVCSIGIKVFGEWVWKADGAGDTDHEAEKGALSDAFKRAGVRWGIGRYLYDIDSPWVAIEQKGKSYVIAQGERTKLRSLLARDAKGNAPPALVKQKIDGAREAALAYVSIARTAMQNAETKEEAMTWWRDEAENREKNGVIEGSPEFKALAADFNEFKRGLPYADLRAAG